MKFSVFNRSKCSEAHHNKMDLTKEQVLQHVSELLDKEKIIKLKIKREE